MVYGVFRADRGGLPQCALSYPGPGDRGPRPSLYLRNCAECHGASLEGQPNWKRPGANGVYPAPPHNSDGHTWHHPDAVLLQIIADGGTMPASAMPAFAGQLTNAEIQAILAYIKTSWGPKELAFQAEATRNSQQ